MLIKNHNGDWGIVIGKWDGARKGVAGIPGKSKKLNIIYLMYYCKCYFSGYQ